METVQPKETLELVSIDLFGPLTKKIIGYGHILVMVDTFPKYTKLYPVKRATCDIAIKKLK